LIDAVLAQAGARPWEEVCGLIGGHGERLVHGYPVANAAPDRGRLFELDPRGHFDALRAMGEAGEDFVGIYHSHPVGPAWPSETDIRLCEYPDAVHVIIALAPPRGARVRAFSLRDREVRELELDLSL
jgi:proteasome lid subunit RPN8/RPN11